MSLIPKSVSPPPPLLPLSVQSLSVKQPLDFGLNQAKFIQHLAILGVALIAVSGLYFIAANWFWLDKSIRLMIPQALLLLTAILSLLPRWSPTVRSVIHMVAGLMIGLSLAVIGQIYQTGADSFWLFAIWSVLLVGWLYRRNIGVFVLWCVISQLALYLFFEQTPYQASDLLTIVSINALLLLQFWLAQRYYPALKYVFIVAITALSVASVFGFDARIEGHSYSYLEDTIPNQVMAGVFAVSALALPLYAIWQFYRQQQSIATSLMVSGLGGSLFVALWMQLPFYGTSSYFVLGILVLIWFALIARLIIRLFPKGRFHQVPLALGAWMAGLFFSAMFLSVWGTASMIIGAILFAVSLLLLRKPLHDFMRYLAYCLLVCGQTAMIVHLGVETSSLLMVVFAQLICTALVLSIRPHWVLMLLELIASYMVICGYLFIEVDGYDNLVFGALAVVDWLFLSLIFLLLKPVVWQYRRAIWLMAIVVIGISVALRSGKWLDFEMSRLLVNWLTPLSSWHLLGFVLWLGGVFYYALRPQLKLPVQLLWIGFALMLAVLGYHELFILLLGLGFALRRQDKLLYGAFVLALIGYLWQLYYRLDVEFLTKSLTIFGSGLAFLLLAWLLNTLVHQGGGEGLLPKSSDNTPSTDKDENHATAI